MTSSINPWIIQPLFSVYMNCTSFPAFCETKKTVGMLCNRTEGSPAGSQCRVAYWQEHCEMLLASLENGAFCSTVVAPGTESDGRHRTVNITVLITLT